MLAVAAMDRATIWPEPLAVIARQVVAFADASEVRVATVPAASETAALDEMTSVVPLMVLHDRRAAVASAVLMSSIVVIIFLMVFKPGS